ncbi:MAG: DUF4339 domain-containing protein [Armatimonadota bacterium]
MDRDDAVWYYRLGGQTLGPVSWAEIEQVTRDAVDPDHLLVARGGDAGWMSASQAIATWPELARARAGEAGAGMQAGWNISDEAEEPAPTSAEWEPGPSTAASEVLNAAAVERKTGRRAPRPQAETGRYPNEMPTRHGLGAWLGQAWEMVMGDAMSFVFGVLLAGLVTIVTLGICGPPMQAGLFAMAVKRFRNEPISPGTVFEGFQYFLPSWGVMLIQVLLGGIGGAVIGGAMGTVLGAVGAEPESIAALGQVIGSVVSIVVAAALFYAMVLVVSAGAGAIEAVSGSWEMTKSDFLSYVGMTIVLQLIVSAGVLACGVGLLITAPLLPCAVVAAYMYHSRRR